MLTGTENTWVSKYSNSGDHYYLGTLDDKTGRFTAFDFEDRSYDECNRFYASKTFLDGEERRVLWG